MTKTTGPILPASLAKMPLSELIALIRHDRTTLQEPSQAKVYTRAIGILSACGTDNRITTVRDLLDYWESCRTMPNAGRRTLTFIQAILTGLGAKNLPPIRK